MIAQYGAAALVVRGEDRSAHPASVDSIPTSGLQEDYNAMAASRPEGAARGRCSRGRSSRSSSCWRRRRWTSGRRWRRDGGAPRPARAVRQRIAPLDRDRYLKADLNAALALCEEGPVLEAVEAAIGPLK